MSNFKAYNRHHWQLHRPLLSPPPRKGGTMGYDALRKEIVLFSGGGLNDTWVWDTHTWIKRTPVISPPGRTHASMTYNVAHANLLLFGGVANDGQLLNDTWIWDGQSWLAQTSTPAPPVRSGACMHYDPRDSNIILFGGQTRGDRAGKLLNDTWTWNGSSWTQRTPVVAPSPRFGAAIVYHASQQQLLLFGGTTRATPTNDTWLWNGSSWLQPMPVSSPPARSWANLVYDPVRQQSILIGGHGDGSEPAIMNLTDTWLWNGTTWECHEVGSHDSLYPPQGTHKSAVYADHLQTLLLYTVGGQKLSTLSMTQSADTAASWQSETWLWIP